MTYNGSGGEQRTNCVIRDIVIHGNRGTVANPTAAGAFANNQFGIGIRCSGARYLTLENVYCLRCAEDGIRAVSGGTGGTSANNIAIINCQTLGNGDDGVDFAGGDSAIVAGQFGYNGGDGLALDGSITLSSPKCWDNFTYGCRITNDDVSGNVYAYDNQRSGVLLSGDRQRINLQILAQDNGKDTGQTNDVRSGVLVSGASTGCNLQIVSQNKQEDPTTGQVRGLTVSNASCDILYTIDGDTSDGMNLVQDSSATSGLKAESLILNGTKLDNIFTGSTTWDPPSLADGEAASASVTVTGARVGDFVLISHDQITSGSWLISGKVASNDLVTATILNQTGGIVDVASGTLSALVLSA